MTNYSWEYVTQISGLQVYRACLIDHYIFFTVAEYLFRLDLADYNLISIGIFYQKENYNIVCVNDTIFAFGGNFDNTNLLVEVILNDDKRNFTTISYNSFNYPSPRTCHSLTQINNFLYLFGGQNEKFYLDDLWTYSTVHQSWTASITKGSGPTERAYHAAASYGNILLIWGGEGISGYLSDMYMYNSLTQIWTEIIPSDDLTPSNRKGACMVFQMPFAYIFGGTTTYGVSNELWKYDFSYNEYTLISNYNQSGVSYSNCQLENDGFYSFCGSGQSGHIFYWLLKFNLTSNTWSSFNFSYCFTQGIDIKLGLYFVHFGGRSDNRYLSNDFVFITQYNSQKVSTSYNPYNTGFAYVGSVLYFLYGGCITSYNSLDYNRGSSIFASIDMIQISKYVQNGTLVCSAGYYLFNFTCLPCKPGTYSSGFGNTNCTECGKGTYNNQVAATSITQCYPCPYGTFNNELGASLCLYCPAGLVCNIGSYAPKPITYDKAITSVQPSNYVSIDYSSMFLGFQLSFGLFSIVIILLFSIFARNQIEVFDIFRSKHSYELGKPVTLTRTKIGGVFSLFCVSLALVICATILLGFFLNNAKETKVLQPLSILLNEISTFKANLKMNIAFDGYGDSCVIDSWCSSQISIEIFDLKTVGSFSYSCSLVEKTCIIELSCFNCEIDSQSYIVLLLNEKFSYASSITVNITSTSSIPESISSETSIASTTNHQLFIGTTGTQFYFTLIPSLFVSTVDTNTAKDTGYHVLVETLPILGSQYSIQNIQGISLLKAVVYLIQSPSGLYTQRYPNQSFVLVVSGLLGSISGIIGGLGFLMSLFERNLKKYYENRKRRVNYLELKKKRSILIDSLTNKFNISGSNTIFTERDNTNMEIVKID